MRRRLDTAKHWRRRRGRGGSPVGRRGSPVGPGGTQAERGGRRPALPLRLLAALLLAAVALPPSLRTARGAEELAAGGAPSSLPIARVDVEGHESLSRREIVRIVAPETDAPFDEARVSAGADSLVAHLADLGRPFARVAVDWSEGEDGVTLTVRVDEGPEVKLEEIEFDGVESIDPEDLSDHVSLSPGDVVTAAALERDVDALLDAYAEVGRPFATVTPASAGLGEAGGLILRLDVDEGLETWFGDVVVSGSEVTKDYVVTREARIERGELYSASALEAVRPRLDRLGIFRSVSDPMVAVDPATGEATVGIDVEEGTSNSVTGVLGYTPSPVGGGGEFTGKLDIRLMNIAGTGRQATAEWLRPNPVETRIAFSYREPWFLGAPIDVGLWGRQAIRDTIYTTTEGDLYLMARMGDRTRVTWSVGGERYVPGAVDESTTLSYRTALAAEYDGTDLLVNPTTGSFLRGWIEYAAKEERDTGDGYTSAAGKLKGRAYLRVRPKQVIALEGRAEKIVSTEDEIPFHELLVLGGASGLRGYREEQFRGDTIGLASVEYRFILGRYSRVLAFVDLGYYRRGGSNPAKDTKLGYGIGLRGETRLGIIGVDYGLGEGDGLLDGKLHVGLIREF